VDIPGIEADGERRKGASKIARRHAHIADESVLVALRKRVRAAVSKEHFSGSQFFFRPCAIVKKSEPEKGYFARVKIVRPRRFGQVWGAHLALERGRPQAWKEIVKS